MGSPRSRLLSLLRVPPDPAVPARAGSGDAVRVFRAAPAYFRYRLTLWALKQGGALAGLLFGFAMARRFGGLLDAGPLPALLLVAEVVAWTVFLVQLPLSYALLRLDFELRWYILSDRSLRIREGILRLREKTMTFANIQEITIRRNPLQGLLRIADVRVRTAGGGSHGHGGKGDLGESMHEAYFRGVDDPELIRDAVRERVRLHRDSGLGDPDELAVPAQAAVRGRPGLGAAGGGAAAVDAARELWDEVRALRRVVESQTGESGSGDVA